MCLELFPPKSSILVSSDHILFQNKAGFSRLWLANSRQAFTCLGFSKGIFLGVWECTPTRWSVRLIVSLLTFVPAACSSFWSSPHVVNGLCITYFTRMPFSRQIGSQPMFLPFPNDGPNPTNGDLDHVTDLSISHSTIMMVNYNHTKLLRELLCLRHSENLPMWQPNLQWPFKAHGDVMVRGVLWLVGGDLQINMK